MLTALDLFNQQKYDEAILELNAILLINQQNTEAHNLRGKCWYNAAHHAEDQDQEDRFFQNSYNDFSTTITQSPTHKEALLYRAYLISIYYKDKQNILLQDAQTLIQLKDENCLIKGLDYQAKAHYALNQPNKTINALEVLKQKYQSYYKDNLPVSKQQQAECIMRIGDVHNYLLKQVPLALALYKNAFALYRYNHFFNYDAGTLALENKEYNFAAEVLDTFLVFVPYAGGREYVNDLIKKIETSYNESSNTSLAVVLMLAYRMQMVDTVEQISFAKKHLNNSSKANHFIGSALFDEGDFKSAFPYFKNAAEKQIFAMSTARYIVCNYKITGKCMPMPSIEKFDDPIDLYSAGVEIQEGFYNSNATEKNKYQLAFYECSFNLFTQYFYQKGTNEKCNHSHYYAMLCNNYGIALSDANRYAEAIPIHKTGYRVQPFWEQLNSLGFAQLKSEQHTGLLETSNTMLEKHIHQLPLDIYVSCQYRKIKAHCELKQNEQAQEVYSIIMNEQVDILTQCGTNENLLQSVTQYYGYIIAEEIHLKEQMGTYTKEESIANYENQLNENIEDEQALYMLLQNYAIVGDYEKAIGAANYYLKIVGDEITDVNLKTVKFRRGESYLFTGKYDEAITDLNASFLLDKNNYWCIHRIAQTYYGKADNKNGFAAASWCLQHYKKENFEWDEHIEVVTDLAIKDLNAQNKKDDIKNVIALVKKIVGSGKKVKELHKQFGGGGFFNWL
jgi:tetratricopeptide (TPR) repeat protein